jgi:hypothetical protein
MRKLRMVCRLLAVLAVVLTYRVLFPASFAKACEYPVGGGNEGCFACGCLENTGGGYFGCTPGQSCGDSACIVRGQCSAA